MRDCKGVLHEGIGVGCREGGRVVFDILHVIVL